MQTVGVRAVMRVLEILPPRVRDEITRLSAQRMGGIADIREIALRVAARCTVNYRDGAVPLLCEICRDEMDRITFRICDGAVYAYRESIRDGYVPFGDGVRVGVVGMARYARGGIEGVSSVGSLIFRIPHAECDFEDELYAIYDSGIGSGMMIYSAPGVGKTSALRSLARHIGGGKNAARVAVIDERGEFMSEMYEGCSVDILRGYKRCEGIDIATRTMAPDVILTDELSRDCRSALEYAAHCGVPIIATAHADSLEGLLKRRAIEPLLRSKIFNTFVGIKREGGKYVLAVDRI